MTLSDEDCKTFKQLYFEDTGLDLTVDEARGIIARLCTLFERFAEWMAAERSAGRSFDNP